MRTVEVAVAVAVVHMQVGRRTMGRWNVSEGCIQEKWKRERRMREQRRHW